MDQYLQQRLENFSVHSSSPGEDTPVCTVTASETSDEELSDLVLSWEDAIHRCKDKLNPKDYDKALQYSTPEKLLEDLREREKDAQSGGRRPWLTRLYIDMAPTVRMLEKTSAIFLVAMQPKTIETRMIYVLFYIIIELSLQSQERWKMMQAMLEKETNSLRLCKHTAQWVDIDEELRSVLLKIFKALILFWANSAQYMKDNPQCRLTFIEAKFENTTKEIDEAVKVLEHYATMRKLAPSDRNLDHDRDLAAYRGPLKSAVGYPCYDVPELLDTEFCGRNAELQFIDDVLSPSGDEVVRQRACSIHGIAGVGKSRIALTYANRFKASYDAIFVIQSENESAVSRSFTRIARKLRLREQEQSGNVNEDNELVQQWLLESGKKWLLIWDNVEVFDHIRSYWPPSRGSLLLTTRYKAVAVIKGETLQIQPFDSEVAWKLFATLMRWSDVADVAKSEVEAAKILLSKLQGLALGIRHMVALIQVKGQGIEHFLGRFKKGRMEDDGSSMLDDYHFSLDTVWKSSFSILEQSKNDTGSHAFHLLGAITFLSPDRISKDVFIGHAASSFPPVLSFCQDEHDFEDAAEELVEIALIDSTSDYRAHSVHRLVQSAFEKSLDDNARQMYFGCAVTLLFTAFPQQVEGRPLHLRWKSCERYIQHVMRLANYYLESQSTPRPLQAPIMFAELMKSCGWYLHEIGDKFNALTIVSLAISICSDHNTILYAHLSNTMFAIYFELNDLIKARPYCESALDIRKRLDTEEEYCNTLGNMGNLLSAEGRLTESLCCFEEAESIRQRIGDDGIIGYALVCLGIGRAKAWKGDYISAEERFKLAKDTINRKFGQSGHFMQDVHYAYGNLERSKGNLDAAQKYYHSGLNVLRVQGMQTHIHNAAFLYKLSCISVSNGDLHAAGSMLEEALRIAEQTMPASSGDVARVMYKQAKALRLYGASSDVPELAKKEVVSAQFKAMIEQEKLPPTSSEVATTNGSEDAAYDRLVCSFLR